MSFLDLVLSVLLLAVVFLASLQLSETYMAHADRWTLAADVRRVAAALRRLPSAGDGPCQGGCAAVAGNHTLVLADSGLLPPRMATGDPDRPLLVGGRYPVHVDPAHAASARIAASAAAGSSALVVPRTPGAFLVYVGSADIPVSTFADCQALLLPLLDDHTGSHVYDHVTYAAMPPEAPATAPAHDRHPDFGQVFATALPGWFGAPSNQPHYRSGAPGQASDPASGWRRTQGPLASVSSVCTAAVAGDGLVVGYFLP